MDFTLKAGILDTVTQIRSTEYSAWLEEMGLPHLWVDVDGNSGGSLLT